MPQDPRSLMIFAAGLGTRMGALTREVPKPLLPVGGRALIDHALDLARGRGGLTVAANTHYLAGQLADHLAGTGVRLSHEPRLLDTGGGLKQALPLLGPGPVFTLNSDAVWKGPNPLDILAGAWRPEAMDALLLLVPIGRTVGRQGGGDFSLKDGRLSRGGDMVYTGAQIIAPGALDGFDGVFSLNLVWDRLNAAGRLGACEYPGHWGDVGHPEGLDAAEGLLARD